MAAISKLRIDTGAVKIEVNDKGECIVLPFGDQSFPTRFFNLIDSFQSREDEYKKRAEDIDNGDLSELEKARAGVSLNLEIHEKLRAEIDAIFGPETCRKVFGDIVPSIELYAAFFEALTPYFEKYGRERQKQMAAKYNAGRKGNV